MASETRCPDCGYAAFSKGGLANHRRWKHSSAASVPSAERGPFGTTCDRCKQWIADADQQRVLDHLRTCQGPSAERGAGEPRHCPGCGHSEDRWPFCSRSLTECAALHLDPPSDQRSSLAGLPDAGHASGEEPTREIVAMIDEARARLSAVAGQHPSECATVPMPLARDLLGVLATCRVWFASRAPSEEVARLREALDAAARSLENVGAHVPAEAARAALSTPTPTERERQ